MKEDFRKKYLEIRKHINNRKLKDQKIFNLVINHEKVKNAKTILIYVSYNNEVDTIKLIQYFLKSKRVAVPKIINNKMYFCYLNSLNDLTNGSFNILEPINNNLVIDYSDSICFTPGVCFSADGKRIGYGKGYYDKFFKNNKVYSIGLCYKECLDNNIILDEFDEKVNEVIYY